MMKRVICCLLALILCVSLSTVAFAADDTFVPSIPAKDHPELVPGEDGSIGVIKENGEIKDTVDEGCLVITPVSQVETSTEIPEDSRTTLREVYEKLSDGSMELPYEEIDPSLDSDSMVIRDLFDATFVCGEHPEMLAEEGVVLELTFDLGVDADEVVYVMTYIDGKWIPIVSVVNNGDGTVTCVFEDICPIAFSVASESWIPETGEQLQLLWFVLLAVSAAALVGVTALRRRKAA